MDDLPKLALSIRQPWAHCILHFGKTVENRNWSTRLRGEICIHAAKGMTQDEWLDGLYTVREVAERSPFPKGSVFPGKEDLQFGGIVGVAEIADVVTAMDSPWFFGPYGFVLRNVRPVPFIPVKGALGFFEWRKNIMETAAC